MVIKLKEKRWDIHGYMIINHLQYINSGHDIAIIPIDVQ